MFDVFGVAASLALILLFAVVVAHASIFYLLKKNRFYLYIMALFLLYIIDNLVIYLTESLDVFAHLYNEVFMSVPTVKTALYIGMAAFMILIQNSVFRKRFSVWNGLALIVFGLWLMFVPMLPHGVFKIWLYFLPFQIFTFSLSLSGLHYMNRHRELREAHTANRLFRLLLLLTLVFSVLIALEDFYVIFFVDDYSSLDVSIYQRNHCEDVLRILYSIAWIRFFTHKFAREKEKLRVTVSDSPDIVEKLSGEEPPADRPEPGAMPAPAAQESTVRPEAEEPPPVVHERAYKVMLYAQQLHLTSRESEILKLLLDDKTNQEISDALFISIGTVKTHVHNIYQKVDVNRRGDLIRCFEKFEPDWESGTSR